MRKLCLRLPLLTFFAILALQVTAAKKGYEIKIKFNDLHDTVCYLANYFGEKTYLQDTAVVGKDGRLVFEGEESLPGGIYIVALGKNRLFEFLIDQSQFFSFETSGPDYVKNMKIKGSPENVQFYDYLNFNARKYTEAEPLQKMYARLKDNKDSSEIVKKRLENINKEVEQYKLDFIAANPDVFMAVFFKALKDPDLPEAPLKPDGKADSLFLFRWYKDHYWDNIRLTDDKLLRTPFFHNKIVTYFDKLVVQLMPTPDSVCIEIDKMIEKVRPNKEMFKYFVWYLTNWSETSNVMGFDKVFVHMVETYYMTNQAYWVNPTVLENLTKKAKKLKNILIGKIAPDMIMLDTNMRPVSMHAIRKPYTIIYFWDPECGHCKTESPKLRKFYDEYSGKLGFEIFGVCSDTNMAKMKEYIRKNEFRWINVNGPRTLSGDYHETYDIFSTPVIYLLDENKKIIAKRLMTDQLEKFLIRYDEDKKKGILPQ